MDLYHEESVSSCWLMQQYKDNHHLFNLPECSNSSNIAVTVQPPRAILTQMQKYKDAFVAAQKLATLASEVSMERFQNRLTTMQNLISVWEKNEDNDLLSSHSDPEVNVLMILFSYFISCFII